MSTYKENFLSLDLSKQGVWLDMQLDDYGSSRYWMTIDGEEIELTEKQYRVLVEQRVEAHKASKEAERERIIQLIRNTCAKPEIDEDGSFIYSEDIVDLILKESNG